MLGRDLTLRIATELHLKRLVVGGFERVCTGHRPSAEDVHLRMRTQQAQMNRLNRPRTTMPRGLMPQPLQDGQRPSCLMVVVRFANQRAL